MSTLLGCGTVLLMLVWLIRRRRAAAVAAVFLLFSLVTRTLALVYVDLAGPVYAIELDDEVGGGPSMPLFAAAVMMFLLPLAFFFRPSALRELLPNKESYGPAHAGLRHASFAVLLAFVLGLYVDMLIRGPIPLFAGIDRLEYTNLIAGPLHPIVMQMGFLLAGLLGVLMVVPRVAGHEFDFRFLGLFAAVMVYFALTGNRFSAFYAFTAYFAIPLGAIAALAGCGRLTPAAAGRGTLATLVCSRSALFIALAGMGLALAALLVHSYVTVRGYDDPAEQFAQRSLVQPVQLWWVTWRDLQERTTDAALAWDAAFANPLDGSRNTSIQVLMIKNLGNDRAAELLDNGQQYAGGYPEILFELLGPDLALPVALAFGIATAWLLRLAVVSTAHGRVVTAFLAIYVFYGFSLLYIGGMLNFLLVWTYWVKCGALALAMLIERGSSRNHTVISTMPAPAK